MKQRLMHIICALLIFAAALAVPLGYAHASEPASGGSSNAVGNFLEERGIGDIFSGTDFGKIIEDFGNLSAPADLFSLAQEAFASGSAMLQDVFNGGSGTSNGTNTVENEQPTTPQTTITYQIAPMPTTSAQQPTAPPATAAPATAAPATAAPAAQTPPATVPALPTQPAGTLPDTVTVPNNVNVQEEDSGPAIPTVVIVIVLAVVAAALIVCIVVFFIKKKTF